ncbi:uncharacterized protein B0H18DRAFT_128481 [Fomitopsis serialis]|uniref:uncharacterized protein n=1 Tax=Fomitopsis serialis TaxID=139415 RepID=UPI00200731F0|nr:uncharacterized protein B0H18DRAFT_128481 [Neoantrodia serialis]KAH9930572.1 hypothetical protein B0H18DRAFT_128481 [Neoantrodia serialis]
MSLQLSNHQSMPVAPPNPYGFRDPRSVPGKPRGVDILIAAQERQLKRSRYERWMQCAANRLQMTVLNSLRKIRNLMWRFTLGRWFWIKACHGTDTIEVETMRMISSRTRIPVPHVWTHFVWSGRRYIIMSRITGVALSTVWYTAEPHFREVIVEQLANCFDELRTLRTPYGRRICSVLGGQYGTSDFDTNM